MTALVFARAVMAIYLKDRIFIELSAPTGTARPPLRYIRLPLPIQHIAVVIQQLFEVILAEDKLSRGDIDAVIGESCTFQIAHITILAVTGDLGVLR